MNKIKKELKGNKYTVIAIIIFALVLVFGMVLYRFLFPNSGKAIYGNRLDGIDKVQINEKDQKSMASKLEENAMIDEAKMRISGKILKYTITIKKGIKKEDATSLNNTVLGLLSQSEIEYYDIQIDYYNTTDSGKEYLMQAYKNKTSKTFSYSGDK